MEFYRSSSSPASQKLDNKFSVTPKKLFGINNFETINNRLSDHSKRNNLDELGLDIPTIEAGSDPAMRTVHCTIGMHDPTKKFLSRDMNDSFTLTPNETERLLDLIETIREVRKKEITEKQERRSQMLVQKISKSDGGIDFLAEHSIVSINGVWCQIVNSKEDLSVAVNFFAMHHSYILESWLGRQAQSCMIKGYSAGGNKTMYQVSYGFADQTFLEAEGPTKEGAIFAVAEDLLK